MNLRVCEYGRPAFGGNGRHYRDGYGRNGRLFLSAIRFKAQQSVTKPEPCGAGKICESLTLPHWSQQEMPERACQRAPGTAMSRVQARFGQCGTRRRGDSAVRSATGAV